MRRRKLNANFSDASRKVGVVSAFGLAALTFAYVLVLGAGLLSLTDKNAQISDPWFSLLEILILLIAPLFVSLFAALHDWAPPTAKTLSRVALCFALLLAGVTCCVHFTILTVSRATVADEGMGDLLFAFKWPSAAYALDILAWDVFFPLAALFAAPLFFGSPLRTTIRFILIASGLLALAGLSGVVLNDMQWRNIGIIGYAIVFPIAAALIGLVFLRSPASSQVKDSGNA